MTATPDKVYSIWLMTGIKEHKVIETHETYILIRHGGTRMAIKLLDGVMDSRHYYPTWDAAHTAAIAKCQERIKQAKKEIKSNERAVKKLEEMKASGR